MAQNSKTTNWQLILKEIVENEGNFNWKSNPYQVNEVQEQNLIQLQHGINIQMQYLHKKISQEYPSEFNPSQNYTILQKIKIIIDKCNDEGIDKIKGLTQQIQESNSTNNLLMEDSFKKMGDLYEKIESFSIQRKAYQKEIQEGKLIITDLSKTIGDLYEEIWPLSFERKEYQKEIQEYKLIMADSFKTIKDLHEDIGRFSIERKAYQKEIQKLREKLMNQKQLAFQIQSQKAQIRYLKDKNTNLIEINDQQRQIQNQLKQCLQQNAQLQDQFQKQMTKIQLLKNNCIQLQASLSKQSKQKKQINEKLQYQIADCLQIKNLFYKKSQQFESERKTLAQSIDSLKLRNNHLLQQISKLQKLQYQRKKKIELINEQMKKQVKSNNTAESGFTQLMGVQAELRAENTKLRNQLIQCNRIKKFQAKLRVQLQSQLYNLKLQRYDNKSILMETQEKQISQENCVSPKIQTKGNCYLYLKNAEKKVLKIIQVHLKSKLQKSSMQQLRIKAKEIANSGLNLPQHFESFDIISIKTLEKAENKIK